ncbi:MAG: replication restart helicase PriA, partial [Candidatus Cloacimonadia bacterium]
NGRDVAVMRGKLNNALVILGSATPSLDSYYNVKKGKYQLLEMRERIQNQILPAITIVDMRQEKDHKEIFSQLLKDKIEDRLKKKEQTILFQNRRGYASYIQCVKCGHVFQCKNCNISLTYHSYNNRMVCHYCGYNTLLPRQCPNCGGYIYNFGLPGTEKIEKNLEFLFPTARIARMDTDTTQKKQSHQLILDKVKNGYVDILLGTQMIIKGLDFPNVTLVGIISADVNLNLPDFRSAERNFQHITQVAGRAGRSEKKGEVVVQTYNPMHYSIQFAQKHDFNAFAKHELALREKLHYPPFTKLARLLFMLNNQKRLRDYMNKIRRPARKFDGSSEIIVLGPVSAPISKIRGNYRYHIVLKAKDKKAISRYIEWFDKNIKLPTYIKTHIDIDPISLL